MAHIPRGFTIVELLIVIIVIGILATLVLLGYNGVQNTARNAKIKSDTNEFSKAVQIARLNTGQSLYQIVGSATTAQSCISKPSGTNLATLPQTDQCWVDYNAAMSAIATAAKLDAVKSMKDPWGRPYLIDENEGDPLSAQGVCTNDYIAAYPRPTVQNSSSPMPNTIVLVPNGTNGCAPYY